LPNPSPILADLVTIGPDRFLRVTVPKNPAATDITITVEASPEVQPASWSPSGLVTETNTTTLLRVRDGVPADSAPHRFLRVRVGLNRTPSPLPGERAGERGFVEQIVPAFQASEGFCGHVTWAFARNARSSPGYNGAGLRP